MPRYIRIVRALLASVAVAHGAAIVVLVSLQGVLATEVSSAAPALNASDTAKLVLLELVRTVSFHAVLVVVCGVYAAKISSGSRRVFRIVVASQVLSIVFGIVTWFVSPEVLRFMTAPFMLVASVILVLLVGPGSARAFFSLRKRPRPAASPV